ncbi:MAG TPA: 4,5-DOPA dioxygenase extradiol [Xanthomonadaceae bacterium]|nr:4,5-DOPA dioxygenase extradiol [Xanthomonadaceae bacterium]
MPAAMPAAFLGHGSPMNALERNRYTEAWRAFGASVPRPRAILMVSAHWYVNATAVTAMATPRTIHDFYGFPPELFAMRYPAPGLPALAEEIADAASPDYVGADLDSWGLDHGTWSVLVHAFPAADVPVVQLAINARQPPDYHARLGERLAALRTRGVLLMGSGNVVHNLRAMARDQPDGAYDWARRFDEHARQVVTTRPADAPSLVAHPDFPRAAPTPEHFLPLLYITGFAAAAGEAPEVLVDGYSYGSLSMASFAVGAARAPGQPAAASGVPPLESTAPPEDTNL